MKFPQIIDLEYLVRFVIEKEKKIGEYNYSNLNIIGKKYTYPKMT